VTGAPTPKITIALTDDHTLFRQGLRQLLLTDPDMEIVGEGATGDDAVALVDQHRPDVLLLDVEMPGPGARHVITRLTRSHPDTAIVVLTMHNRPAVVRELMDCGAAAYLVKTIGRDELIAAVRAVTQDRDNVLLSVPRTTIDALDDQVHQRHLLSGRELEVLQLVAAAMSNAQIAARLVISESTVKRHLTNIYAKLGATSRVDALNKAAKAKLIDTLDR
jgi:DNA-binding NarL/FixJ family response regulator